MENRLKTIRVRDANGDEFTVYEFRERPRLFGLVATRRYKLCTGEIVEPLDAKSFVIVGTNDRLTRIASAARDGGRET